MLRPFLAAAIVLPILGLLVYTVQLNPGAQASPPELNVVTKTSGHEEVKATILDGQVSFRLKNNHRETITAFAINIGDLMIKEDFAYSDVHFGIEPGDTFEKSYSISRSPEISALPTLYLHAVLLKNGAEDGNSRVSQEIKDERLGEKIQIHRTLRILEKEGLFPKDLEATKSDIVSALNAGESETRINLSELQPNARNENRLSDDLTNGLHWGREKMLRRFEVLEQLPAKSREQGFMELKARSQKLFAKL